MSYIFKVATPRFPLFTMAVIYEDYRVPIYSGFLVRPNQTWK